MFPFRFQSAEGNTYNIVTQEITNPSKISTLEDKSLHRYRGREELLKNVTIRSQEKLEIDESRKLNRVSFERYKETLDRGYDFVFADAKLSLKPLPQRPGTVWDRLQGSDQMGGRAFTSGRQHRDLSGTAVSPARSSLHSSSSEHFASAGRLQMREAHTAVASSRDSSRHVPVPTLDMTRAQGGTPVTYTEPLGGAPGQPVPIVRTGGLGAMGSMAMSPY